MSQRYHSTRARLLLALLCSSLTLLVGLALIVYGFLKSKSAGA
jgi:hypothetical protein